DGRWWVGTKSGRGVISNQGFRQFYPEDGVARNDVRALAEDAEGNIWVGAGDGVLTRVASNDGVTAFRPTDSWAGQPIWSLHVDKEGVVWAGTFRGGLLRFQNRTFTRYTTR